MPHMLRHAIPNGLSLSRLVLAGVFPWLTADGRLVVILIAAVTDFLDGVTARWLRAESETGRLLDPIADKAFVLVLVITLIAEGVITPGWAVAVAARDVVVMVGAAVVAVRRRWSDYRRMQPTWLGKATTAAQFALLLVLAARGGAWVWLLALTASLSIAAGADYAWRFRR